MFIHVAFIDNIEVFSKIFFIQKISNIPLFLYFPHSLTFNTLRNNITDDILLKTEYMLLFEGPILP